MGLIKATVSAVGGTLKDQWQDLIQCEDMTNDILMMKKTTKSGQISKGSRIIVAPGQVAVVYDSGAVVDATAEEGVYTFDQSSSPSFFGGQFKAVFKEMWQRFTYNGIPAKEQAIFYFNLKEILDNKFGTVTPIPYQDWSHPIPNNMTKTMSPMSVKVRCFGKYTFKIIDPAIFMRNHAGTADVVTKEIITEQMRSEVISSFQNVLNELGTVKFKVPVLELPSNTDEIKKAMDEKVFDEPIRQRGIQLVGFAVESVTLDDESSKKIDNYELSSNTNMQQGTLVGSYATAVESAAKNESGSMNGFMGVGMMNMASGGMIGGVAQSPFNGTNNEPVQPIDPFNQNSNKAKCNKCGAIVDGKFCSQCGTPVVAENKKCSNCGKDVQGNFCTECGTQVQ